MSQTVFNNAPDSAFAGMVSEGEVQADSYFNENAAAQPFGIAVKQGTAANQFNIMAAQNDKVLGFLAHNQVWPNNSALAGTLGCPIGGIGNVVRKGKMWVLCEETVAVGDPVYVRHTTNGAGKAQVGAVRNDNDGVAAVLTVTPTAGNNELNTLNVFVGGRLFKFSMTTDGSGTAAEVVTAFKAAMAVGVDPAFAALVTATGTDTLILTGLPGMPLSATAGESAGVLAVARTTEPSTKCDLLNNARFAGARTGAGIVEIEFNLP